MDKQIHPKISVFIITYNQEDLIGRALDSVLSQKEYIYELLVSDDSSTDNNWEVIKEYEKKHPGLIKAYKNEKNLGIFGNTEAVRSKCSGDVFIGLTGDDEFTKGYCSEIIKVIQRNNIDLKNERFCIYFNFLAVYPSGLRKVFRNNLIEKPKFNPVSLKVRGLISTRGSVCSIKLISLYKEVPKNIGRFCDELMDIQKPMLAEKNYYSPFIASTYYSHIGVSVKTSKENFNRSMDQATEVLKKWINFSKKDSYWLDFQHYRRNLLANPGLNLFLKTTKYYFKSLEWKYGLRGLGLKRWIIDLAKIAGVYSIVAKKMILKK